MVDFFSDTPAERAVNEAKARAATIARQAERKACEYVEQAAQAAAKASDDAQEYAEAITAKEAAAERHHRAQSWHQLVRGTQEAFEDAASKCRSASSSEMLDTFTKSKAISLMSTLDTSDARASVQHAVRKFNQLKKALPKRADHPEIEMPDDTLDLVLDFTFNFGFDVTSICNMFELDRAASKCNDAAMSLDTLRRRTAALEKASAERLQKAKAKVWQIEKRFRRNEWDRLPAALRDLVRDRVDGQGSKN